MYSDKEITLATKLYITNKIEKELEKEKLKAYGIDKPISVSIKVLSNIIDEDGKLSESNSEITMVLSILSGILIYFFIFMYGSQVMRGVIEEKTSRIIEVIVSSVRPFELMMGKIIGIAMVGLTQFLLWIVLTFALVTVAQSSFMPSNSQIVAQQLKSTNIMDGSQAEQEKIDDEQINEDINNAFKIVSNINWLLILSAFLFYFIGGYLLYASLFAAVGAAVDSEADTQQFMLPITIPLILGMVMIQSIVQNPDGDLAFWFSIIPFTSPIIMMARLPFSVPDWQVYLSMGLLIVTFILTTKFAAKIYRVGILMYGKKVNYKELWKWLKY
jgi:ABC-2 type transport system permease protein